MRIIFFILHSLLLPISAMALSDGFYNSSYDSAVFTIEEKILGRTCYSMQSSYLAFSCNPAFLANENKQQFRLNIIADSSVKELSDYRYQIANDDLYGLINKIDENSKKPHLMMATSNLWFQSDWWGLSYTPIKSHVVTHIRNTTLPEITALMSTTSELMLRAGAISMYDSNLSLGANLRYVTSEFIRQQFRVIDVIADPNILEIKKNQTVYLEPGLSYKFDVATTPTLSATLTDLAIYKKGDSTENDIALELGLMTSFYIFDYNLRTSIHYSSRNDISNFTDRFRLGGIFEFSPQTSLSFDFAASELGLGVLSQWGYFTYGLGYNRQKLDYKGQSLAWNSELLAEIGLSF
ncbi:MAG: hypothetical protein H6625_03325 [Bdellovibrionaceae bacterium]|nr:hypothetical protein [Pseudobdellovibrionaceae bacterium]